MLNAGDPADASDVWFRVLTFADYWKRDGTLHNNAFGGKALAAPKEPQGYTLEMSGRLLSLTKSVETEAKKFCASLNKTFHGVMRGREPMSNNITEFPTRDLIAEMTGPDRLGNDVIIGGRRVPNMIMFIREGRDEIEFCLADRVMFGFPRAQAWDAAAFAFAAMAVGAGCDPLNFEPRPFALKVVKLGGDEGPNP